jgi:hypothetical protein
MTFSSLICSIVKEICCGLLALQCLGYPITAFSLFEPNQANNMDGAIAGTFF